MQHSTIAFCWHLYDANRLIICKPSLGINKHTFAAHKDKIPLSLSVFFFTCPLFYCLILWVRYHTQQLKKMAEQQKGPNLNSIVIQRMVRSQVLEFQTKFYSTTKKRKKRLMSLNQHFIIKQYINQAKVGRVYWLSGSQIQHLGQLVDNVSLNPLIFPAQCFIIDYNNSAS